MPVLAREEWNALLLSTLAGLSTTLGALIAVSLLATHGSSTTGDM